MTTFNEILSKISKKESNRDHFDSDRLLDEIRDVYQNLTDNQKQIILTHVCDKKNWGYTQKFAVRLFDHSAKAPSGLLVVDQIENVTELDECNIKFISDKYYKHSGSYEILQEIRLELGQIYLSCNLEKFVEFEKQLQQSYRQKKGLSILLNKLNDESDEKIIISSVSIQDLSLLTTWKEVRQAILDAVDILQEKKLLQAEQARKIKEKYGLYSVPTLARLTVREIQKQDDKQLVPKEVLKELPEELQQLINGPRF